MEYTSNQRAAIFLVARWTHKLKKQHAYRYVPEGPT